MVVVVVACRGSSSRVREDGTRETRTSRLTLDVERRSPTSRKLSTCNNNSLGRSEKTAGGSLETAKIESMTPSVALSVLAVCVTTDAAGRQVKKLRCGWAPVASPKQDSDALVADCEEGEEQVAAGAIARLGSPWL